MMFVTNWILAITAIVASLIGFIGMILILKKSQKYFVARQENLGNLNGHIEEVYGGHDIVKVFTYVKVREDDISIYGFKTQEELRMFELLIGVARNGS